MDRRRRIEDHGARRPLCAGTRGDGRSLTTGHDTEGVGLCQRRGGPIEVIRPGDSVFFEPGEDHWHGAAPNRVMTHIAIQEADDSGSPVSWGEHVTDEEYNAPTES